MINAMRKEVSGNYISILQEGSRKEAKKTALEKIIAVFASERLIK